MSLNLVSRYDTWKIKKRNSKFNIYRTNLLNFEQNKKLQIFVNIMFGHSMIPIINKTIYGTKKTVTILDHVFTNSITKFKRRITKSNNSGHYLILFVADCKVI